MSGFVDANNNYTPRWYQYKIDTFHPIGCGPVAWSIVYAYWQRFKARPALFDAPNAASLGAEDAEVIRATDTIARLTETSFGQAGGAYGFTGPHKMCNGLAYANSRGYPHATCQRVRGTERDKFAHIKHYIDTDRPVVLTIHHDGIGELNHYVVIEGYRIREERSGGGSWRLKKVEYYVNFAWQNAPSQWITVREVGANTGKIYSAGSAYLIDIATTPQPHTASANEAACKDWCSTNAECRMCSHLLNCGPGFRPIRRFTVAGPNWTACAQRGTSRARQSESNRLECEAWCDANKPTCAKCDTRVGCGADYKHLKSFRGPGNNWHACSVRGPSRRERGGDQHKQACFAWCDANKPACVTCSTKPSCGIGFKTMKSWTGSGRNWYACSSNRYGRESANNKAECDAWCNANKPPCVECSTLRNCGAGRTAMKHFRGPGDNWFACRVEGSASNRQACEIWCAANSRCVRCDTDIRCGRGHKSIKSFRGPGDNWFACARR